MALEKTRTTRSAGARTVRAVYAICLIGCGSGSSPATGIGAGAMGDAASPATFTAVYTEILQPTCSPCHQPGQIGAFQDLSSRSAAYSALVGVKASGPSCGSSGETRVVPGNASQSLLFQKVSQASPSCGSPMPLGGPPLPGDQVTLVENWINAGAPNE